MSSHPSRRFGDDTLVLDDETVDRLLDGLVVDDAPPGYETVADLLEALRSPSPLDDAAQAEASALAMFRAARADGAGDLTAADAPASDAAAGAGMAGDVPALGARAAAPVRLGRVRATHGRARRVGFATAAVAGLSLLTATSAAAMTGALPGPAQRAAHDVMQVVGVHVPAPLSVHVPRPGGAPPVTTVPVPAGAPAPALRNGTGQGGHALPTPGAHVHVPPPKGGAHTVPGTLPAGASTSVPGRPGGPPSAGHGGPGDADGGNGAGRGAGGASGSAGSSGDVPGHGPDGPGNSANAPGHLVNGSAGPDGSAPDGSGRGAGGTGGMPGHAGKFGGVRGPGTQGAPGNG
jgi:hypothetical protein